MVIDDFRREFLRLTHDWNWEVQGFLDTQGRVHPIDTDTKVISTVFERLASPVVRTIARESDYAIELSNQTTYPDFTLTHAGTRHRIAIDIKTTYLSASMGFTLGGYNSFLRNDTKNILYPYSTYAEHWVAGFIYEQGAACAPYYLDNMPLAGAITCPYTVRQVFIREKHAITGLRAGSGNTKNIGSIKLTNAQEFTTRSGPFCQFREAKKACDHYWRDYERYVEEIASSQQLLRHPDFEQFRPIQ